MLIRVASSSAASSRNIYSTGLRMCIIVGLFSDRISDVMAKAWSCVVCGFLVVRLRVTDE